MIQNKRAIISLSWGENLHNQKVLKDEFTSSLWNSFGRQNTAWNIRKGLKSAVNSV